MAGKKYDVLGIGNSIVDILSFVEDDFLARHGFRKGVMTLVDDEKAAAIYDDLGQTTEISGGSAANTCAGIAALGGKAAFIGRVHDDELGKIFSHDLNSVGVDFSSPLATDGKTTARCLVMVTPDADRSMATYLGACTELDDNYIDESLIADAKIVYIEGYLWDEEQAINAIKKAISLAKENGAEVAFTLSDPFCVSRHQKEFLELLPQIDILFCNEEEANAMFNVDRFDKAIPRFTETTKLTAMTRGEHGSVVISADGVESVAASEIGELVDTTGAGDLYAAGFLHSYAQGKPLAECAAQGSEAAGKIIQQLGARLMKPL